MADPRKSTRRPDPSDQDVVRQILHMHLMACTDNAAVDLGCTGVSVVTMGVGMWAAELAELDARATASLLRALADLFDTRATPASRSEAENRRAYAASQLHVAVDLEMSKPSGRA